MHYRYPKRPDEDKEKLVEFLKDFMYLVLVKRVSQEYCLAKINAELLKPAKQRMTEDLLDNLFHKLKPLGESDSPLDPEVEEKICIDEEMNQEVEQAAEDCGVNPESVSYLGFIQNVEDLTPEERQDVTAKRLCINRELEWINV